MGNLGQPDADNLVITNNLTYMAPSLSGSNVVLGSGTGLTATGNYVVGGDGLSQGTWTNATVAGNTVIPPDPAPTQTAALVRPNAYEPGRAFIVAYNWSGEATVTVDVSGVLSVGDQYVVRNVRLAGRERDVRRRDHQYSHGRRPAPGADRHQQSGAHDRPGVQRLPARADGPIARPTRLRT